MVSNGINKLLLKRLTAHGVLKDRRERQSAFRLKELISLCVVELGNGIARDTCCDASCDDRSGARAAAHGENVTKPLIVVAESLLKGSFPFGDKPEGVIPMTPSPSI
jgi:hypothetical protein